jgi:hypothetical protein
VDDSTPWLHNGSLTTLLLHGSVGSASPFLGRCLYGGLLDETPRNGNRTTGQLKNSTGERYGGDVPAPHSGGRGSGNAGRTVLGGSLRWDGAAVHACTVLALSLMKRTYRNTADSASSGDFSGPGAGHLEQATSFLTPVRGVYKAAGSGKANVHLERTKV